MLALAGGVAYMQRKVVEALVGLSGEVNGRNCAWGDGYGLLWHLRRGLL